MKEDLTGKKFGRLTAIHPVTKKGSRKRFWRCRCDCGNETVVEEFHLKSGHTKSCGCYRRELPRKDSWTLPDGAMGVFWFWDPW